MMYRNSTGFVVISISLDCKVHFNANLLIQNQRSTFGLKQTVLYQFGHIFVEQHIEEIWISQKVIIIGFFESICLCITGIVVVWLTFKWVHRTVTVPNAHPHEMEKLNIPKREERLSTIAEEGEHITFSKDKYVA
jgi:hypothetical protein